MNITLIAFQDEKMDSYGDRINFASVRILHPENAKEAGVQYQELIMEAEDKDQQEWEITILFNGREATENYHYGLRDQIESPGDEALKEARRRRAEEIRKQEELRKEKQRRADEEARVRREKQEREEYERLKRKFGGERLCQNSAKNS